MTNRLIILLIACAGLFGCGDKTTETEQETSVFLDEEVVEKLETNSEAIKSCEDFLTTYETWTDDLIELMIEYKDDPIGLATSPQYINTMMLGVNFMQDWEVISTSCALNSSYTARMEAIHEKMKQKQKELGLK